MARAPRSTPKANPITGGAADEVNFKVPPFHLRDAFNAITRESHGRSVAAGWWVDHAAQIDLLQEVHDDTRLGAALVAEKLSLIHSEVSEALEGFRKDAMDDKLENRKQVEVELADAVIRIADLAGALGLDVGGAIVDKLVYNANRADHLPENRVKAGGKRF